MSIARISFREQFTRRHVVLPVIHVSTESQAIENTHLAFNSDADGVFLINHMLSPRLLLSIHARVAEKFPGKWIGLNCLGVYPADVFPTLTPRVSGVWTDNAFIEEHHPEQPAAQETLDSIAKSRWTGLYFGGVAFKYQREVRDLHAACHIATRYMDVVTTSGPGTGKAAQIEKIRDMKTALGDFPLAIASGITPDNVSHYLPHADCFLVATGISKNFETLDPALTQRLIQTVRDYDRQTPPV